MKYLQFPVVMVMRISSSAFNFVNALYIEQQQVSHIGNRVTQSVDVLYIRCDLIYMVCNVEQDTG